MNALAPRRRRATTGFTLIELMITLVIMGLVLGSTLVFFRGQSRGFRLGGDRMDMDQNARYVMSTLDRVLRTAGAGITDQQAAFVYGGDDVVAVNTNYTQDVNDWTAVNVNPDVPESARNAWSYAQRAPLPNTAWTYPLRDYTVAPAGTASHAETVIFYFRPDSGTARTDDYALFQRVNGETAELVARNILPYPGRPFFEYVLRRQRSGAPDTLVTASGALLPIAKTAPVRGSPADVDGSARADSVRMIRVNISVTNDLPGAEARQRQASTLIGLPNNGLRRLVSCGGAPMMGGVLSAVPNVAPQDPAVTLTWAPSVDETSGEGDVVQYNIYRRLESTTDWGTPFRTVAPGLAAGQTAYTLVDDQVLASVAYRYAVTAQDCSPQESSLLATTSPVTPAAP